MIFCYCGMPLDEMLGDVEECVFCGEHISELMKYDNDSLKHKLPKEEEE